MGKKARPHPKPKAIPLHLKAWRKHRGLTQAQLAERLAVSDATVSRIESGEQNWDQEFLQAAAEVLRCAPADLLVRDPTQPGAVWSLWERAAPGQREQIDQMAAVIVRGRTGTND